MQNKITNRSTLLLVDVIIQATALGLIFILSLLWYSIFTEARNNTDIGQGAFLVMVFLPIFVAILFLVTLGQNMLSQIINFIWQFRERSRITQIFRLFLFLLNMLTVVYFGFIILKIKLEYRAYYNTTIDKIAYEEISPLFSNHLLLGFSIWVLFSIITYFIFTILEMRHLRKQIRHDKKKQVLD